MSVRADLEALLTEEFASVPALSGFRVVATERALDDIQQPTALIRLQSMGRLPEAPLSHRLVGITLTLISGHTDMDSAADELEEALVAALDLLDTKFQYDDATAVGYGDRLAYDIPLKLIAS